MKFIDKKYNGVIQMIVSIIALMLLWMLMYEITDNSIIIPSLKSVFEEIVKIVKNEKFPFIIFHTLKRVFICFLFSLSLGVVLGFISGFNKKVYYLLKPLVLALKSIPTMAITLIAIIWLRSNFAPILVAFLVVFPIIYTTVIDCINNIDNNLLEMAYIYKFPLKKKLFNLYIPSVKETILNITISTIGLIMKVIIAAEILVQPKVSIGAGFQIEKVSLNTAGVFAWCIIVIVLVTLTEYIVKKILNINLKKC